MRLRERNEPLDPEAERELAALEDALAGRPVEPDLADLAELTALLSEERPESDPSWAAELDERASRRFRQEGGGGPLPVWLEGFRSTRMLATAGALATL